MLVVSRDGWAKQAGTVHLFCGARFLTSGMRGNNDGRATTPFVRKKESGNRAKVRCHGRTKKVLKVSEENRRTRAPRANRWGGHTRDFLLTSCESWNLAIHQTKGASAYQRTLGPIGFPSRSSSSNDRRNLRSGGRASIELPLRSRTSKPLSSCTQSGSLDSWFPSSRSSRRFLTRSQRVLLFVRKIPGRRTGRKPSARLAHQNSKPRSLVVPLQSA